MDRNLTWIFAILILVLLPCHPSIFADDKIRVVTTTPDLADIVRQVGGDRVDIICLTNGSEDLHKVRPRPQLLNALFRADVLVQIGLDLEHSWLPQLLKTARNAKIRPGSTGFINCSSGIDPLDVPLAKTRKEGPDLHIKGNPHYNLSPMRTRQIIKNVILGMCLNSPEYCEEFTERGNQYLQTLDKKIVEWKSRLEPLKGAAFIEYHPTWSYFAKDFDLKIADRIESKAGVVPQASQLAKVVEVARQENVGLIVSRPVNKDMALKVASNCNAQVVVLPHFSSTTGTLQGYIPFMEHVVKTFEENLRLGKR